MPITNAGVARLYKGGLVTAIAHLALFVGNVEVAGNNYSRKAAAPGLWTVADNKIYLTNNLGFPEPSADWGAVDRVKLMSAAVGGDVLADWDGNEFSLVDGNGDVVANVESGNSFYIQGGAANGLSVTIPLA